MWEVLVGGGAEDLAEAVLRLPVTHEAVENLLRSSPQDPIEGALRTLVRNRVARGGLLAPGSGRMRLGEARRGLLSRWYPRTLAERIRAIGREAHRIAFLRGDGLAAVPVFAPGHKTASHFEGWHIDYPYPGLRAHRVGRYRGLYAKRRLGLRRDEEEPRLLPDGTLFLGNRAGRRLAQGVAPLKDGQRWESLEEFLHDLWATLAP